MTPLRVMQSYPVIRATTNPYIAMLDHALTSTPGLDHLRFTWRTALFGRIDVIHFHWPETLFNSSTAVNRLVKRALVTALVVRLKLGRVAVVRTVHNLELPHDITRFQRALLMRIDESTDLRIRIGATTTLAGDQPSVTILHGDYRDWFATKPRRDAVPGRLSFIGLVRRYKGVETLISAFREIVDPPNDLSLVIAGRPTTTTIADDIRGLVGNDPRITLRLDFLNDEDFVAAMTDAQLVVLPYRFMHNSGSLLAALSLDRPVLVPRNDANTALAHEVGESWIVRYDGELDAAALRRAAEETATAPRGRPDLSHRGWHDAGARHAAAYASAVELRSRRRSSGAG